MRFRTFYIIILFTSIHGAFGMQSAPRQGFWGGIKQKAYSACQLVGGSVARCANVAKRLALSGIRWAWRNKLNLACLPVEEYFSPSGWMAHAKTREEKILHGALQVQQYISAAHDRAKYANYEDERGVAHRCYKQKEPARFKSLTRPAEEDLDNLNLSVMIKLVPDKIRPPEAFSPFFKGVARRIGRFIVREGIREGFVVPCMNFGGRIRREGLGNTMRSLWLRDHATQPAV